jgi:hypothetical protein
MSQVEFHEEFEAEYDELDEEVQDELLAHLKLLERFGPQLGRPHADTLKGSTFTNMKELRFWRSLGGSCDELANSHRYGSRKL